MGTQTVSVALVGLDADIERVLEREDGLAVRPAASLAQVRDVDAIVLGLDGAPIEAIRTAHRAAPDAAIVVVTNPAAAADGAIAVHAGAEDHLVRDELLPALLPRAIRYAVAVRAVRRDLATIDDATKLPNLRGFGAIAQHHLRMADRSGRAVVFVFVRLEDHAELLATLGPDAADELTRDAAAVVLDAVRDSDVPARVSPDTLAVLLTGDAEGAESMVLSRLVEAIAVHDASRERPRSLALSVGTTRYEPGSGTDLAALLGGAVRGLGRRPEG